MCVAVILLSPLALSIGPAAATAGPALLTSQASYTVSVRANASTYYASSPIGIQGTVSPVPPSGTSAFVQVLNSSRSVVQVSSDPLNAGGEFWDNFTAGGTGWANGTFTVNATWAPSLSGPVLNATTSFVYVSSSAPPFSTYTVTFTESGLPSGRTWSVTFNGTPETSATGEITFAAVVNGTYSYTVGSVSGYTASPSTGSVTVPTMLSISVTFSSAGSAASTPWWVWAVAAVVVAVVSVGIVAVLARRGKSPPSRSEAAAPTGAGSPTTASGSSSGPGK